MVNTIERNLPTIFIMCAAYYALTRFIKTSREAIAPVTKPISKLLAEIQFFVNDSSYIKYPNAGFVLNRDKLDHNYKIANMTWLKAMVAAHDDHEGFFNEIFDDSLILKPIYRPLLNATVTADSIATAART